MWSPLPPLTLEASGDYDHQLIEEVQELKFHVNSQGFLRLLVRNKGDGDGEREGRGRGRGRGAQEEQEEQEEKEEQEEGEEEEEGDLLFRDCGSSSSGSAVVFP